jgi:hypothetical protein
MNTKQYFLTFLLVLAYPGANYANSVWEEWENATVFFDDGTSIQTGLKIYTDDLLVNYDNEKVAVPFDQIESIEMLSVKKGRKVTDRKANFAESQLKLSLKSGMEVTLWHNTSIDTGFTWRNSFVVLRRNPLTRIVEEKTYMWIGHRHMYGFGNPVFDENKSEEKRVYKVIFE